MPVEPHDGAPPPALDSAWLGAGALRERFARRHAFAPEWPGDGARFGEAPAQPRPAAVLVPLVARDAEAGGTSVLLTRRTDHLRDHAGQVSFPGGRAEPGDADAAATALREAAEEIGLHARHVEILGELPRYRTVTQYVVTPVVALVHPPFEVRADPREVAEAFEVPLAFLMDPAHHRRHAFDATPGRAGGTRHFLSMPWTAPAGAVHAVPGREYFVWGATAAMLRNLYRFIAARG